VADVAMVEQRPMMEGRRMVMIIGPRVGVIRPGGVSGGGTGTPRPPSSSSSSGGGGGTSPPVPAAAAKSG
jgi:hypothetical protein